jgi:hypothetical protein
MTEPEKSWNAACALFSIEPTRDAQAAFYAGAVYVLSTITRAELGGHDRATTTYHKLNDELRDFAKTIPPKGPTDG